MTEKVRTTVVLPAATAAKLRDRVPPRKRSEFVAEAIERHLMQLVFEEERKRTFGIWRDENYPDLKTREDMSRYIAERRDDDSWRGSAQSED
ncbi:MAG: hypothetical protein HOC74_40400 [Gemmatimonadetes bacterium]|jgi:hypothetical protein|nr:hypothetical protein [Gemmatimonadota bacterium]